MIRFNLSLNHELKGMNGPNCNRTEMVKNGSLSHGKQKYKCKGCGRQFVENPQKHPISEETQALIGKLLLEKIPLAGIARVATSKTHPETGEIRNIGGAKRIRLLSGEGVNRDMVGARNILLRALVDSPDHFLVAVT